MRSAEREARRPHTVRTALRDTTRRLETARVSYGHGTTNARDEAAWLVLHALGLPLDALDPHLRRRLNAEEQRRIAALVDERIRTRKPTAYLTREAWLGDQRFYVDERVLIPRSYIAELLRDHLAPWALREPHTALDLCTGSGCLAILLALSFPRVRVDASDISRDALDVARRNVADYELSRRIRLICSDLYTGVGTRRYDLIVANPPYVRSTAMRALPAEYRREPALALAGGRDGLDLVRRIVAEAPSHLNTGGLLVVEVGHNRRAVEKAFPLLPLLWAYTSGGDDCVFLITREALESRAQLHSQARCPRAIPATASPRLPGARSPARASAAAAARRRRNARASAGSR